MLNFYKQLISCRNNEPALQEGDIKFAEQTKTVLAYKRSHGASVIRVFLNFGYDVEIPLKGSVILQNAASQHGSMMAVQQYGFFLEKLE